MRITKVGVVGCGQMGSGVAHTIRKVEGMRVRLIADIRADRAVRTLEEVCRVTQDVETNFGVDKRVGG